MLRNIIREWLATMGEERDLDAPLMAYLGAAGYRDIHLTHGPNEIGKDIIAKKNGDAGVVQYAIQTKRGDIGSTAWRDPLRGQMWEAVRLGLTHPAFDPNLERQGVLVLTGRLAGNAQQQIDLFNAEVEGEGRRRIEVWHNETLVEFFDSVDPSTIYPRDKSGYLGYGQFFLAYGLALDGRVTPRQVELHSRRWLLDTYDATKLLIPTIETATLATASERANNLYAAFQARLALVRVTLDAVFASSGSTRSFFLEVATESIAQAIAGAARFANHVWELKEIAHDKKLVHVVVGNATFITYPLLCTQMGETLALVYFGSADWAERNAAIARLRSLVTVEQGISKVFTDSQAVSVVMIIRALADSGEAALARRYLRAVAFEALNLYANRLGMASLEDDEQGEVDRLLGMEFSELRPPQRNESFMATAILDLCAHLGDGQLFEEVVNDIQLHRMHPRYYRPLDTRGQFRLDADDVVWSVHVEFTPTLQPGWAYGQHLVDEPQSFRLFEEFGPTAFMCVSLLLRDRYFPATWLASRDAAQSASNDAAASP